jgi:cell wall-associated NlpC family hydrolase
MQFIPSTWKQWGRLAPNRPGGATPSPQNAWDEIYSAAAYLCGGRPAIGDLRRAILSYDDSEAYVQWVLNKAAEYGMGSSAPPSNAGAAAVAVAMRELGVPYVYGGESPEVGFDCSGLVQWAYAQVGVSIPRVTLEQVRVGTPVSLNDLQPGDLIFMRGDVPVVDFGHVAMYVGGGIEINAPHTGAVVSLRPVDPQAVQAIRRVA